MKDLESLAALMTGTYKDVVDNLSNPFQTLDNSPCVYRLVSVNRKALLPEVVKLSALRFMTNAMHGAPRIEDLEKDEGWMDGGFTPAESKKRLAEVKSRFLPVLKKSGISEKDAAYPGAQIIKLGFAWDAKWTVYLNEKNQPKHRTIGTTALIKIPGEKYYTA